MQMYFIDQKQFEEHFDELNPFISYYYKSMDSVYFTSPQKFAHKMAALEGTVSINKYLEKKIYGAGDYCFNVGGRWTVDFYGPLLIPYKGLCIELDSMNVLRYSYTINKYEGVTIAGTNNGTLSSGTDKQFYTFRNNYYFMMGDNRHNSNDSRYIGLIPEDRVLGRTQRVLVSVKDNRFVWDRFCLKLE